MNRLFQLILVLFLFYSTSIQAGTIIVKTRAPENVLRGEKNEMIFQEKGNTLVKWVMRF